MEHQVRFKNTQGENLSGTLHQPREHSDRGIIIGHCFTCSRHTRVLQQMGLDLTEAGFQVLRFDFSGNGQSEGVFVESSYSKHVSDMKAAMTFLTGRGVAWLGLAGHSMGAVIALLTAAREKQIRMLCLLAGRLSGTKAGHFLDERQQAEIKRTGRVAFTSRGRSLELSREFFTDADRFDLPETIRTFDRPVLVVHGDRDEIVPVEEARRAQRINPGALTLSIIAGADHMFSDAAHRRRIGRLTVDWFTRRQSAAE